MTTIIILGKRLLPVLALLLVGSTLVIMSQRGEAQHLRGYATHTAAAAALSAGNIETAYLLYLQSADEFTDPKLKSLALYEAANVGWSNRLADYQTLVSLYQQSLRYQPGFTKAAHNLEYLYWLKANAPSELPQPSPGAEPSREEEPPNGDV